MRNRLLWGSLALVLAAAPAGARTWNPDPASQARDYSIITDNRPNHEVAILFWLSAPTVGTVSTAQAVLDQYLIIGAVHGQFSPAGTADFDSQPVLVASDGDGKTLKPVLGDAAPPTVQAMLAAFGGVMRQSMGAVGQGMHLFVFESGNVHACSKGKLSVAFAGTTYSYDTPIPGCPKP